MAYRPGSRHPLWWGVVFVISWFLYRSQVGRLNEKIDCLSRRQAEATNRFEGQQEEARRRQEEDVRRTETLAQLLSDTRTELIVMRVSAGQQIQVPGSPNAAETLADGVLGSFSGQAMLSKRMGSTLWRDFELSPGAGKVAGQIILQQDDLQEAERVLDVFTSAQERRDEAYPYAALAIKFVEKDEMTRAQEVLMDVPDSAQEHVDAAIGWALSDRGADD